MARAEEGLAQKHEQLASPRPLGIPFSGEYWMYRWPYRRPPDGSLFRRGSPLALAFHTTDRTALQMEARQRLDQPIRLSCCVRIQVALWNGDRYPGTVALELILADNGQPARPSQSLGVLPVKSSPGGLPMRETVDFPIPAACGLEQFDELRVVLHRDSQRADKSARIEIDGFLLVPAGAT